MRESERGAVQRLGGVAWWRLGHLEPEAEEGRRGWRLERQEALTWQNPGDLGSAERWWER